MANEHQGLEAADFPVEWQPVEDPSFTINVNIHIACDEPAEIFQHLYKIAAQIRRKLRPGNKASRLVPVNKACQQLRLLDNNCYGTHAVDINFNTQPSSHETLPSDHQDTGSQEPA